MKFIILMALILNSLIYANSFLEQKSQTYDITNEHSNTRDVISMTIYKTSPIMEIIAEQNEYSARVITLSECQTVDGVEHCPVLSEKCEGFFDYSYGEAMLNNAIAYENVICETTGTLDNENFKCQKDNVNVCSDYLGSTYVSSTDSCDKAAWEITCDNNWHNFSFHNYLKMEAWNPSGPVSNYAGYNFQSQMRYKCINRSSVLIEQMHKMYGQSLNSTVWSQFGTFNAEKVKADKNYFINYNGAKGTDRYYIPKNGKISGAKEDGVVISGRHVVSGDKVVLQVVAGNTYDGKGWTVRDSITGNLILYEQYSKEPKCPSTYPLRVGTKCYAETFCKDGYHKTSNTTCQQNYQYYTYFCEEDENNYGSEWVGPISLGEDCLGECSQGRTQDCICNSKKPPKDNCKRKNYLCGVDESIICALEPNQEISNEVIDKNVFTYRPLLSYAPVTGGINENGYGQQKGLCSGKCSFNIKLIQGSNSKIYFSEERQDDELSFIEVQKCKFTGTILGDIAYIKLDDSKMIWEGFDKDGGNIGSIISTCEWNGKVGFYQDQGFSSVKTDGDKLLFYASYSESGLKHPQQGFLQVMPQLKDEDKNDGYNYEIIEPIISRANGGDIVGLFDDHTLFASNGKITEEKCSGLKLKINAYEPSFDTPLKVEYFNSMVFDSSDINKFNISSCTEGSINDLSELCDSCKIDETYNKTTKLCEKKPTVCEAGWSHLDTAGTCSLSQWVTTHSWPAFTISTSYEGHAVAKYGWKFQQANSYVLYVPNLNQNLPMFPAEYNFSYFSQGWQGNFSGKGTTSGSVRTIVTFSKTSQHERASTVKMSAGYRQEYKKVIKSATCTSGTLNTGICESEPKHTKPNYTESTCLLEKAIPVSVDNMEYAVKTLFGTNLSYVCSPLTCQEHVCGLANCVDGYDPLINNGGEAGSGCIDSNCDANLPYIETCGIVRGCDETNPTQQYINGECYQMKCDYPAVLNYSSKFCEEKGCATGYVETSGGLCISN
ncbi:MAG: hypothetical protein COB67_00340 [SAR324 cluster bacterium]|uniref:Uncharacterized protein n=1 Tax=SAR324 cluster bacterium TaxID=2024889 RepID=A0A2A4TBN7_9DELT|nr:MAG: hypothetical protein COB67_00340 [SAR324 cluster bacterium]